MLKFNFEKSESIELGLINEKKNLPINCQLPRNRARNRSRNLKLLQKKLSLTL